MKKRTICLIQGKRGGFNALLPTLLAIARDPQLDLKIVLTDMHLARRFGRTISWAKQWIKIDAAIDLKQKGASPRQRTEALGRGLIGMTRILSRLKPDMLLLLGDRSEILIAAFAAVQLKIPIAHIQGGEVSGNIDGIQRHAITKLSHLHFAETKQAAARILKLGEESWRVHRVGAPYVDFIRKKMYTPVIETRKKFGLGAQEEFLLVLQHPVTTDVESSYHHMRETLAAVKESGLRAIVVYPCSDQGYKGIIDAIEEIRADRQFSIYKNIPAEDFIGLEAIATALVGNSSAGIYEAPYVYCPFVNVGTRQRGRERERNVIDVVPKRAAIAAAIQRARSIAFRKQLRRLEYLYGDGKAYQRIIRVLKSVKLDAKLFEKQMAY